MTPSKVSAAVVAERIAWVEGMLAGIRALPLASSDDFGADPRTAAAAESYLRRALEALMDLGRHVLAKGYGQAAAEYRDIGRLLDECGVIGSPDITTWLKMAAYRNRMVHFYAAVSQAELYELCASRLGDIEGALAVIRGWVATNPDRVDTSI